MQEIKKLISYPNLRIILSLKIFPSFTSVKVSKYVYKCLCYQVVLLISVIRFYQCEIIRTLGRLQTANISSKQFKTLLGFIHSPTVFVSNSLSGSFQKLFLVVTLWVQMNIYWGMVDGFSCISEPERPFLFRYILISILWRTNTQ